ncbi:MAG: glycosyltransferase family 2 protein [Rhodocyclaceae bacterium]|nr:glycosyltransferase family 2 protein [Rhodocyclaceae bacterium]MBK6906791.1 glycosyltransferase family 2 protein [Rhodocyclaceae bacterium]
MSEQLPLVSVIVPCYNQGRFLEEAIASLIAQTYPKWECLIINDGSTDDTRQVALELARTEPRIRLFEQANCGLAAARNSGLREARGDYIQLLDADDELLPDKFATQVALLQSDPFSPRLAYCSYSNRYESEISANTNPIEIVRVRMNAADPLNDVALHWEAELSIPIHCFLFDTALFKMNNIQFDEHLPNHEDWDCLMRILALKPRLRFDERKLAVYRRHLNSMSAGHHKMHCGFLMAIRKQQELLRLQPETCRLLAKRAMRLRRIYWWSRIYSNSPRFFDFVRTKLGRLEKSDIRSAD